jgi:hypothetical protein
MRIKPILMTSLAFVLATTAANAGALTYVVNISQQFGTVDLATGAFQQIGPNTPEGNDGLVAGPNGSLLTLSFASNLYSINPATGATTLVGPTGLDDCTTPASSCGPASNLMLGGLDGNIYATDFQNSLYSVNPLSGAATLIGPTGIPAIPFIPGSLNPDGTLNFYDQAIFGAGGKLYATFDAWVFDPGSFSVVNIAVAPALYKIDPSIGLATLVGPTDLAIGAVAGVNGTYYAFNNLTSQVASLNLANGNTSFVSNYDPAAGPIFGAVAAVPEPASIVFVGIGIAGLAVCRRRKRYLRAWRVRRALE